MFFLLCCCLIWKRTLGGKNWISLVNRYVHVCVSAQTYAEKSIWYKSSEEKYFLHELLFFPQKFNLKNSVTHKWCHEGKTYSFFFFAFHAKMVELKIKKKKKWLFYIHNNAYNCFHITYMKFISLWICEVIDFTPVSLLSSVRMSWYIFSIWSQWVRTFFRRLSQCGESSPSSFSSWFLLSMEKKRKHWLLS